MLTNILQPLLQLCKRILHTRLCDKHVCEGRCSGAQAWVLVLCQGTHAVAKACMRELSPDPY